MTRDPLLVLLSLLASVTAVSLGLSGEAPLVMLAIPAAALYAVVRPITAPRGRLYEWTFQLLAVAFLLWFFVSVMRGRVLAGAVALTVPAQLHALLQPPTHATLRRLQLLSFFKLVALAAATTRVLFGPLLVVHVVLAPITLTLGALERAGGEPRRPSRWDGAFVRASLAAAGVLALAGAVAFLVLPRYEAGLLARLSVPSQRISGFSGTVALGDITRIQTSPRLVMRVKIDGDSPDDMRFRGMVLDHFSGREWTVTAGEAEPRGGERIELSPRTRASAIVQEYTLEPLQPPALFLVPRAVAIEPHDFPVVRVDAWGNVLRGFGLPRRLRYRVISQPGGSGEALDEVVREAFLQVPEIDPRVATLATSVAGDGADIEKARAIESWLLSDFAYTLDVNDVGVADPVSAFLFERKAGHCEYFATAMTLLLRHAGVPARLVTGFTAGERSRFFGNHVVRQRDAHAWVEAWIEGRGWTAFDPTPPSPADESSLRGAMDVWDSLETLWDDNVIGFNYTFQLGYLRALQSTAIRALDSLGRGGLVAALALVVGAGVGLALLVGRRRARARAAVAPPRWYLEALRLMAARSQPRRPNETPVEYATAFARRVTGTAGDAAIQLTRLYNAVRHGGHEADARRVAALLRDLKGGP